MPFLFPLPESTFMFSLFDFTLCPSLTHILLTRPVYPSDIQPHAIDRRSIRDPFFRHILNTCRHTHRDCGLSISFVNIQLDVLWKDRICGGTVGDTPTQDSELFISIMPLADTSCSSTRAAFKNRKRAPTSLYHNPRSSRPPRTTSSQPIEANSSTQTQC